MGGTVVGGSVVLLCTWQRLLPSDKRRIKTNADAASQKVIRRTAKEKAKKERDGETDSLRHELMDKSIRPTVNTL